MMLLFIFDQQSWTPVPDYELSLKYHSSFKNITRTFILPFLIPKPNTNLFEHKRETSFTNTYSRSAEQIWVVLFTIPDYAVCGYACLFTWLQLTD